MPALAAAFEPRGTAPNAALAARSRADAVATAVVDAPPAGGVDVPLPPAAAVGTPQALVEEAWTVVADNFLDARHAGFDPSDWRRLRVASAGSPAVDTAAAHAKIRSMLSTLGDPYSRFISPGEFAPLRKYDVTGVGLNLTDDGGTSGGGVDTERVGSGGTPRIRVAGLILGSPAAVAGIGPGDYVTAVDGAPTAGRRAFQVATAIATAPGPNVTLNITRGVGPGAGDALTLTLARGERPVLPSPVVARLQAGGVGYIKLREFDARSVADMAAALQELRERGADKYVLDLRDNLGGLVPAGLEIARLFLPADATVAYTEGTFGGQARALRGVPAGGGLAGATAAPVVVLVNGRTASAAEILAGALQHNCRAALVGGRTYGKGLIQSVYELSDGSGLVLTVGQYLTPSRVSIDGRGLEPDFAFFPGFDTAAAAVGTCVRPPVEGRGP